MWLLNVDTLLLEFFIGSDAPPYAILSHTWGKGEITHQDILQGSGRDKDAWAKLEGCCQRSRVDGLQYCWIDTCCIDKTSSAELSEAINSMFQWYKDAFVCYAYLADVEKENDFPAFQASRWFTRGWTLQELIAPTYMIFFTQGWTEVGTKISLCPRVAERTGIPAEMIRHERTLESYCVAIRMSWAADRMTTREEDVAYSLFGIFGVNLPLLYGERARAFTRLQEEIMRKSNDASIFAWMAHELNYRPPSYYGFLAPHIGCFGEFIRGMRSSKPEYSDVFSRVQAVEPLKNANKMLGVFCDLNDPITQSSNGLQVHYPILDRYDGANNKHVDLLVIPCFVFRNQEILALALQIGKFGDGLARHWADDASIKWVDPSLSKKNLWSNHGRMLNTASMKESQLLHPHTQHRASKREIFFYHSPVVSKLNEALGLKFISNTFPKWADSVPKYKYEIVYGLTRTNCSFTIHVSSRMAVGYCQLSWDDQLIDGPIVTDEDVIERPLAKAPDYYISIHVRIRPARPTEKTEAYGADAAVFTFAISSQVKIYWEDGGVEVLSEEDAVKLVTTGVLSEAEESLVLRPKREA